MKTYTKNLRQKLKEKGICVNCHKVPAHPGKSSCDLCLLKKRINTRNRVMKINGAWYWSKLKEQDNKCAICQGFMKTINIDHDHATGKVRGLLCTSCNTSLGKFKDNPAILRVAADYIEDYKLLHMESSL